MKISIISILFMSILFVSCSSHEPGKQINSNSTSNVNDTKTKNIITFKSPKEDGEIAAKKFSIIKKTYQKNIRKELKDFINEFPNYSFSTRKDARKNLEEKLREVNKIYENDVILAEEEYKEYLNHYTEISEEYSHDSQLNEFKSTYNLTRALDTVNIDTDKYLEQYLHDKRVNQKIFTIIPPKPDTLKIKEDLIGRTISERKNGYFNEDFKWEILKDEIKEIKILNVENKDGDYIYNVLLTLQSNGGALKADVEINYTLKDFDDWTINFLINNKFDIVKTGKYDKCIETHLEQEYVFHPSHIRLKNNADIPLTVYGKKFNSNYNTWNKFSITIKANGESSIDSENCIIHFIEIPV